jgi:hypothetical protein
VEVVVVVGVVVEVVVGVQSTQLHPSQHLSKQHPAVLSSLGQSSSIVTKFPFSHRQWSSQS